MIELTGLEVYNPIYNMTGSNNKFELYKDTFDKFSFEELKDEVNDILSVSDIPPSHLQHEIIGPRNIQAFTKLELE